MPPALTGSPALPTPKAKSEPDFVMMNVKTYNFKVVLEPDEDFDGNPSGWHAYCPVLENKGASTWGAAAAEAKEYRYRRSHAPQLTPLTQRLGIRCRAVAQPAVQLRRFFELLAALAWHGYETARQIRERGHVAP